MEAFQFYSPTQIIFGRGTEEQVGEQIARRGGSRVLVVYGGQSAVKSGLLSRVLASLEQSGLSCDTLGGVKPNPRLSLVLSGIQRAEAFQANFLLAIGGGSVIDTAKAIADGVANPELDLWDDLWMKKVPLERSLPVGVVLTIPAAGSESSDSAVLTKDDTLEKRGLGSDLHRPRFAILNPDLTATLPRYQVACGVVDIMSHTMDRYFNPITTNQLTDELAEGLLRVVISSGRRAMDHPGDYQAMSELMWAGSLSHNGLTGLGGKKDFAPHQLGHELSARFDSAHGATLSAVWGSWARYCLDADVSRFARFGVKVWGLDPTGRTERELALSAIDATVDFFHSLDMPTCFSELGCGLQSEKELEELTRRCTFFGTRTIAPSGCWTTTTSWPSIEWRITERKLGRPSPCAAAPFSFASQQGGTPGYRQASRFFNTFSWSYPHSCLPLRPPGPGVPPDAPCLPVRPGSQPPSHSGGPSPER